MSLAPRHASPQAIGLLEAVWPANSVAEAVVAMAEVLRPTSSGAKLAEPPAASGSRDSLDLARFVDEAALHLGLEAEPLEAGRPISAVLAGSGAVLLDLRAQGHEQSGFLLALGGERRGRTVRLLAPDRQIRRVELDELEAWLTDAGRAGAMITSFADFCNRTGLTALQRERARQVLGGGHGRPAGLRAGWAFFVRSEGFWSQLVQSGSGRLAASGLTSYFASFALLILSWYILGAAALQGRLERGWLWAWMILQLSFVVCASLGMWSTGRLAVNLGGLVRERLLDGILQLPADSVRTKGVGTLLGTVLEADALDGLARSGGPILLADIFQFLSGAIVLLLGATPVGHLMLLVGWLAVAVLCVRRIFRPLSEWAMARLALTDRLVESMVGFRTLVTQQSLQRQAGEADRDLAEYERKESALDAQMARLTTVLPRGWLVLGLAALAPGFVAGQTDSGLLATSLGGVLLVYFAFRRVAVTTGPSIAAALVAWKRIRPLFVAGARNAVQPEAPAILSSDVDAAIAGRRELVVGRRLGFSYPGRSEPVLHGCSFEIRAGDRVLIEGASGAGKSTLGALLCGLRQPSSGLLLLGGFDHHSLRPERWRRRAAGVPQSHENHILSAPLLFNIAMSRRWPPTAADAEEILSICHELGLSELLARMPAGIEQMVGDSGWQLSHGERSRICVARALIQPADFRVLDESFAALDPETLDRVLECVLRRSKTLVVVSHA